MGLYLLVPGDEDDEDDELAGFEVGHYSDFDDFRSAVAELGERTGGDPPRRRLLRSRRNSVSFPMLMTHSKYDGEWSPAECHDLLIELAEIHDAFAGLPARPFTPDSWQAGIAEEIGLTPATLADSFINVDGEPLLSALRGLAAIAMEHRRPIVFQ